MKKKYNIAFIPSTKITEIVNVGEKLSDIADKYKLGGNSIPHVTLCQFEAEEKEIESIWNQVCEALPEHIINLEFNDFSCVTFNNTIFWASLMPNQRSNLESWHGLVSKLIKDPISQFYDPHMTLLSTKDIEYKTKIDLLKKSYVPISDTFVLSCGDCDSIGQFTKILYQCEIRKGATCARK